MLVGVVGAEVVDLAAAGIVAGVGNMEFRVLQGVSRHAVHLFDGQRGLLMVFKINGVVAVGIERRKLRGRVQQIRGRHGLFNDLIHTGQQISQFRLALTVRLDLIDAVAVCGADFKHGVRNRLTGVGVVLVDGQVGAALILQDFCARFSRKQRNMIFSQVEDMVAHGGDLLERPNAGCQALPQNFSCRIGRAVEVVCAVLDL